MSEVVATAQQGLTGKYQPYPEYKDSGVEWLGEVPIDWGASRHKYIATFAKGKNPKELFDEVGIGRHQYLAMGFLRGLEVPKYCDLDSSTILVMENQILIIWDGSNAGEFVKATHGVLSSTMAAVTTNSNIHDGFYWYYCKSIEPEMRRHANGMGIPHVDGDELKAIVIPQPALEEQRSIAAFLDYETARIDRLIAQQQRLIELLKEKRQTVISHAVTKGLNPNAPMKDSGVEWLGQVPKHWIVAGFKKYIEPIVDYRGKTPTKTESGVFLVTARNIKNGSIDYHLSEEFISEDDYEEVMRRGKPKLGDVLFTTEAPLGEVAQVDNESIALAQRIIKFRGLRDILDCSYLKLFIQSTEFQHGLMTFATGSTALGIKSDRLGYLKQLVPPISEQTQIVEVVAKHAMQFGKLIDIANKAIQLMQERRTALISAAVTGKIDLRGWTQPAEEVAA